MDQFHYIKPTNTRLTLKLSWIIEAAVKPLRPSDAYYHHWTGLSLVHVMACCHFGAKPLPEPIMQLSIIGIDTKIEVIVVSPATWEAHHSLRAKPEGCGELPRSMETPQWPQSRYQFLFYHDASKHIKFIGILVCISRKSLINCFKSVTMESMATDHCHSNLRSYALVAIVMSQWCLCHQTFWYASLKDWLKPLDLYKLQNSLCCK